MGLFNKKSKTQFKSNTEKVSLDDIYNGEYDEGIYETPKKSLEQSTAIYSDICPTDLEQEIDARRNDMIDEIDHMPQREICDECFDYNCNGHEDR